MTAVFFLRPIVIGQLADILNTMQKNIRALMRLAAGDGDAVARVAEVQTNIGHIDSTWHDYMATYLTSVVAERTLQALRVRLFAHLQALPISFYDTVSLGDVMSRCTADVSSRTGIHTLKPDRLSTGIPARASASRSARRRAE